MMYRLSLILLTAVLLSGSAQAGVALNQDFNSMPIGPLTTTGQGTTSNVGGWWRATSGTEDPSIRALDDVNEPDNLSLRLSANNRMALGSSDIAPISSGTPFIVSFSVYFVDIGDVDEQMGSFYFYCDALAALSPATTGIAMYNETLGNLLVIDGRAGTFRRLNVSLYDCKGKWVDFKIHVKSWNDGTGYGSYDLYVNKNHQGWILAGADTSFVSSALINGVNAVLFRPRNPSGILNYFDNVSISSVPLDCEDAVLLGTNLAGDLNQDCTVDANDLELVAASWLDTTSGDIAWSIHWDANELPEDYNNGSGNVFVYGLWPSPNPYVTRGVSAGIYSCTSDLASSAFVNTKNSFPVLNCRERFLAEGRIRVTPNTGYAGILARQRSYGNVVFYLWPHMYADAHGWSTFRFVTNVSDANLAGAELYFLNSTTTKWVRCYAVAVDTSNAALQAYDSLIVGDLGSSTAGTFEIDYLYITHDQASVSNFERAMTVQDADIYSDGIVNFRDLASLANSWLQTLIF